MAKTITINFEGTEYTLEYTRKSVEAMEKSGFMPDDIAIKPMSTLPKLFAGAFIAHHKFVKQEKIDEIFSKLENKEGFLEKLSEMLNEPYIALMDEPEKGDEGNAVWGANW